MNNILPVAFIVVSITIHFFDLSLLGIYALVCMYVCIKYNLNLLIYKLNVTAISYRIQYLLRIRIIQLYQN